jgi:hypothetical protein
VFDAGVAQPLKRHSFSSYNQNKPTQLDAKQVKTRWKSINRRCVHVFSEALNTYLLKKSVAGPRNFLIGNKKNSQT